MFRLSYPGVWRFRMGNPQEAAMGLSILAHRFSNQPCSLCCCTAPSPVWPAGFHLHLLFNYSYETCGFCLPAGKGKIIHFCSAWVSHKTRGPNYYAGRVKMGMTIKRLMVLGKSLKLETSLSQKGKARAMISKSNVY